MAAPFVAEHAAKRFYRMIPLYLLVPVLFAAGFHYFGTPLDWKGFGLGALGWWVALLLRFPLILALKQAKASEGTTQTVVPGFSGPAEETIRWGLLSLTSMAFPWAASVGQGWAAIEVLFAVVQGVAISKLLQRDDEKARQAKELLEAQGTLNLHPGLGVIERIFASGIHIGFTLLIAKAPWTVLILIPAHSAVNLGVTRLKGRPVLQQVCVAVVGVLAMLLGILL